MSQLADWGRWVGEHNPVDHTWPLLGGSAVYRIPATVRCTIPGKSYTKVYIGQTGHTLEPRLKEHRTALVSGEVTLSAVAQHAVDERHDKDWEGTTGELIVSRYVIAESITMIAGCFGHIGLCQLHTKLKKLQCETCYIANTGQWWPIAYNNRLFITCSPHYPLLHLLFPFHIFFILLLIYGVERD